MFDLGDVPWRAPSFSLTFPEGQPSEIREIRVEGTGVVITYEHWHETGRVDLVQITVSEQ